MSMTMTMTMTMTHPMPAPMRMPEMPMPMSMPTPKSKPMLMATHATPSPATTTHTHKPVLLDEVITAIAPRDGGVYVDATYGGGGYSEALLAAADCRVVAIDRDPDAIARGQEVVTKYQGRLRLVEARFSHLTALLADNDIRAIDGIAFDFGVSSAQLNDASRGFSFKHDGALDMRMEKQGADAADFINSASEGEIADTLWQFGEERASRAIARAIIKARPLTTTGELANVIRRVLASKKPSKSSTSQKPHQKPHQKTRQKILDPATRSFQALRVHVNNELGEIETTLPQATTLLKPGGHLACVSFHSLEDRLVKQFMREAAGNIPRPSRHQPILEITPAPLLKIVTSKPIRPSADEVATNPRARSARLRVARRRETSA